MGKDHQMKQWGVQGHHELLEPLWTENGNGDVQGACARAHEVGLDSAHEPHNLCIG